MSKLFEVQEYHRGEWIPVMVTNKEGKKVAKTVRISEEHAHEMSRGTIAEIKEKKRSNGFRYVKVKETKKDKTIEEMSAKELKTILDEKKIEYKGNASKSDLIELIKGAE